MQPQFKIRSVKLIKASAKATRARVFVFLAGESILENLTTRWQQPSKAYRPLVQAELRDAGITGKLAWSQRAGCGCGCSPGFIVDGEIREGCTTYDVYITVQAG